MNRNRSGFLTAATASLLLLSCSPNLSAQQALEKSKWFVNAGAHLVQINAEGVHINQPDLQELTYQGIASTRLALPKGRPWQISFDIRFGQLRSAGSGICLFDGNNVVGWVGADVWYKKMGCFIGKDNEVAIPNANAEWHHFNFTSDGTTLTVKEDGTKVGSGGQSGTPDMIKIGDMFNPFRSPGEQPAKMPDGQQTEIWVRGVKVEAPPVLTIPSPASTIPAPPARTQSVKDDSHATLDETRHWICDTINKSAGTYYRNGTSQQSYSHASFDGNNLVCSARNDIYSLVVYENTTIPLDKMDANKVDVSQINAINDDEKTEYDVTVNAANDTPNVSTKYRIVTNSEPDSPEKQEYKTKSGFSFSDLELASRFAKAMRHTILLSKANPIKEPF